jgi:hypothetical protein
MTATITWTIAQLDHNVSEDNAMVAHWTVSAVDEDRSASLYGSVGFTHDTSAPDSKPYEQLTEADVLARVWGSVEKDVIEASLQAQIDAQKVPATLSWAPPRVITP